MAPSEITTVEQHFLETLLAASPSEARAVVERALGQGTAPGDLYLDVITPALHEVGSRWEDGRISIAREHLATAISQSLMVELAPQLPQRHPNGTRAVVTSVDGDQHVVGARMVADFLGAQGWEVLYLGASTPPESLRALVEDTRPAVVALSVTLPSSIPAAAAAVDALKTLKTPPVVAVGGWAMSSPASIVLRRNSDISTCDIRVFLAKVASLTEA